MFTKKFDPLHESVAKVMADNQIRRNAEQAVNEELGVFSKKALPFELHAAYDALLEEVTNEALAHPNQAKLDVNKNNRLDKQDFKMLRGMKKPQGADYAADARKKRLADNGRMDEGKMKDIATEKSEKERLEKMEEQEVNTAGKSDKMTSAPATITTLKPLNKPGLPKLGGMTVAQKGVMKEGKNVADVIKNLRAKKLDERMTGLAPTVQADIRKKEVAKVLAKPNPNTTAATGQQNTGAARIGMTGTKAVGSSPLSDAPKARAVANAQAARSAARTGPDAAMAPKTAAAPKPVAPKPAGTTATGPKLGNQIVMRGKQAFKGSVVKGADGVVRNQNFRASSGPAERPNSK
jgi:hypothetical protein